MPFKLKVAMKVGKPVGDPRGLVAVGPRRDVPRDVLIALVGGEPVASVYPWGAGWNAGLLAGDTAVAYGSTAEQAARVLLTRNRLL